MRISTIIPAYNSEPYLRRAVESLFATNDSNMEIVIVDDGSQDKTRDVALALQQERPDIVRVVSHPNGENRGVSATRNLGIEACTGDWISFLDADDFVYPHRFESARAILSSQPDVDGVYQLCEVAFADQQARQGWWNGQSTFGFTQAIPPDLLILELLRGFCWTTSSLVFRRALLAKSGLFDSGFKVAEDCHLWFRMAVTGKLVAGDLERPVSVYWRHAGSAYQPSTGRKLDMIRSMTSFASWLRHTQPLHPRRKAISSAISDYILNGITEARTSGQSQLAWAIALRSLRQFPPLANQRRFYGHVGRMIAGPTAIAGLKRLRDAVGWRRIVARSTPSGPSMDQITAMVSVERARLEELLNSGTFPRMAIVKQDICEDLYCCPPGSSTREIVESTQLRSGPVALLLDCGAQFHLVETSDAPECRIWMERANVLKWETIEFFASYRDRIPGQQYGQRKFSVSSESIDWSDYDIVISIDVCVPAAVTGRYPNTVWAYYVREIKAPSYHAGMQTAANGQDLFLNHGFRLTPPALPAHVVEFPYHVQYYGCFHKLFGVPLDTARTGTFVDHHTLVEMPAAEKHRLEAYGPVAGPILPQALRYEGGRSVPPRRTMDPDLRMRLLASKYFLITPGERSVHGTGLVEAIAAGCLAIGSPQSFATHGFIFSPATSADSVDAAIERIRHLEADPERYASEVSRQRTLIDWLCYVRPILDLLDSATEIVKSRTPDFQSA